MSLVIFLQYNGTFPKKIFKKSKFETLRICNGLKAVGSKWRLYSGFKKYWNSLERITMALNHKNFLPGAFGKVWRHFWLWQLKSKSGGRGGCYWHLESQSQGYYQSSCNAQPPATKNQPAQGINSVKTENPTGPFPFTLNKNLDFLGRWGEIYRI